MIKLPILSDENHPFANLAIFNRRHRNLRLQTGAAGAYFRIQIDKLAEKAGSEKGFRNQESEIRSQESAGIRSQKSEIGGWRLKIVRTTIKASR
jgi:hypothetical protein